jgi:hypothetical protein
MTIGFVSIIVFVFNCNGKFSTFGVEMALVFGTFSELLFLIRGEQVEVIEAVVDGNNGDEKRVEFDLMSGVRRKLSLYVGW